MQKILITRELDNCAVTALCFEEAGLNPVCLPLIKTVGLKATFQRTQYDMCIFTSPAAVRYFLPYFKDIKINEYFAVGKATADELEKLTFIRPRYPDSYYLKDLLDMLFKDTTGYIPLCERQLYDCRHKPFENKYILSPGAVTRTGDMEGFFNKYGGIFENTAVYKTESVIYPKGYIGSFIEENNICGVTFFSPSAANSFFSQTVEVSKWLKFYSIGTTTRDAVTYHGFKSLIPEKQTQKSIAELIIDNFMEI